MLGSFSREHPRLAVMVIDGVDGPDGARELIRSLGITMPVLLDAGGQVTATYRVAGYPTTVFVRPDGTVQSAHVGAISRDELEAAASALGDG
jgi:hypothetical protein